MYSLPKQVAFDALASEKAARGIASHHIHSMDQFVKHQIAAILTEKKEMITMTSNGVHLLTTKHVHVDKPVAKRSGGFYDWLDPASAVIARHTIANPIVIDFEHRVYTNTVQATEACWEDIDARAIDRDIQAMEAARAAGLPLPEPSFTSRQRGGGGNGANRQQRNNNGGGAGAGTGTGAGTGAGGGTATTQATTTTTTRRRGRPVLDATQTEWQLVEERTYRQVNQFHLPTMLRTIGCLSREEAPLTPNDTYEVDGQFIVKGTSKTLLTQRRLHINRFYVFRAQAGKWTWSGEIRACHSAKIRSTSTMHIHVKTDAHGTGVLKCAVQMPYMDFLIPLMAVCVALGFRSAEEVAICAATGGALSGQTPIPPGSLWDTHAVRTTTQWVLSLLRDEEQPPFESWTRSKVLQWIGERGDKRKTNADRARYAAHLMANEFLPHLGLNSYPMTLARKGQYLAMMLRVMADVARGIAPPDDRDHAGNRQYDTAGMMMANLVRQHYRLARKHQQSEIRRLADARRYLSIPDILYVKRITDNVAYALATGYWGTAKQGSSQAGVSQMLNRTNLMAATSHQRRVNTPLKREGRNPKPRQVHVSSFGHLCPAETPEGPSCGLSEQLAQGVHVCNGHPAHKLIRWVASILGADLLPVFEPGIQTGNIAKLPQPISVRSPEARLLKPMELEAKAEEWDAVRVAKAASDAAVLASTAETTATRVLVNGILIGVVASRDHAANKLREGRRAGQLPYDVAVEAHAIRGMLAITGEAGGLRRPLYRLAGDDGLAAVAALHAECASEHIATFWRRLVRDGHVEYLSKHEEENLMVMPSPVEGSPPPPEPREDYTHCEIHPQCMLGVAAATIPFSGHNQAPRTSYYASMCKQAAGCQPPDPVGTLSLRLWYPQRPLVSTWASKIHGILDVPMGANVWIAVAPYGGRNQEDSLYVNADSAQRGLFAVTLTHAFSEDCQGTTGADAQHFERPSATCRGRKTADYSKLGPDGFVLPGTHVKGGDALIGKTMDVNEMGCLKRSTVRRDQSCVLPLKEEPMEITSVTRCAGRDDKDLVVVRGDAVRFLMAGDKLTSMHGQKGVVGELLPARHMPFTADGIVPDVIINPHAFPSRMTIGQLLESSLGIACAKEGEVGDGTPFNGTDVEDVRAALVAAGYNSLGEQVMYHGTTGEPITGEIFMGIIHYQRVRQMIMDKNHTRGQGPLSPITGQPTEGGRNGGGYRMGDMERDCMQGHGGAHITQDRLFLQSDYSEVAVCRRCGMGALPPASADRRSLVVGVNETAGYCLACRESGDVCSVPMPHATRVFKDELASACIRVQFHVDENVDADPGVVGAVGMTRKRDQERAAMVPQVQHKRSSKRAKTLPAGFIDSPEDVNHRYNAPSAEVSASNAAVDPWAELLETSSRAGFSDDDGDTEDNLSQWSDFLEDMKERQAIDDGQAGDADEDDWQEV